MHELAKNAIANRTSKNVNINQTFYKLVQQYKDFKTRIETEMEKTKKKTKIILAILYTIVGLYCLIIYLGVYIFSNQTDILQTDNRFS